MTKAKAQIHFFHTNDKKATSPVAMGNLGHLDSLMEAGMVARWLKANWTQVREMAREEDSLAESQAYYNYPNAGWWERKKDLASRMTVSELTFARRDAHEAAKACTNEEGKYMDECSIYGMELLLREEVKKP
jgi:hypothetical protein